MALDEHLKDKREEILRLCSTYGARNLRIFGSVARGDSDTMSDYDFLVELEFGRSLFDPGGLQNEMEHRLGQSVDVVTARGPKAHPGSGAPGGGAAGRDSREC
jgi:predicted nucleotidyltransferase